MKRLACFLVFLAVAAPLASAEPVATTATPAAPVAVLSWAGYDAWLDDVDVVGQVSGNPDLATGVEAMLKLVTGNHGLVGLDKGRPAGAILVPQGDRLVGYGYVPVSDLAKLMAVLKSLRPEIEEPSEGVWRIPTPRHEAVYVTQRDGWAVIADRAERLGEAPAAPVAVLKELSAEYDVAVRVFVSRLPQEIRAKLADRLHRDVRRQEPRRPGETDDEYAVRQRLTHGAAGAILTLGEDLDQLTAGWSLEGSSRTMRLDVLAVAKPGTRTARYLARFNDTTTQFAGFRLPEAAVVGQWAGKLTESQADAAGALVKVGRDKALAQIDRKNQSAEKKASERQLAENVFDLLDEMVRGNRIDGAIAMVADPQRTTILAAEYVADGSKLDSLVRLLAKAAQEAKPQAADWIHFDAGTCEGVRLHSVSIPIPPDAKHRAQVVGLVGETLDVVIGVGRENVYLAVGRAAMSLLERAITESNKIADAPPVQWSVALGRIAEFVSQVGKPEDRPRAAALAAILKAVPEGQDRLTLTAAPIPDGIRLRIEAGAGMLQALGALSAVGGAL